MAFLAVMGIYPLGVWALVLARRAEQRARADKDPVSVAAARSAGTLAIVALALSAVAVPFFVMVFLGRLD